MIEGKKLIEVALPLDAINDASAYDKMPGVGAHPKGLHQWWARLPLPTARAIIFASIVDDPSTNPDFKTQEAQQAERRRLFGIVRALMQKSAHKHPEVFNEAATEIQKACNGKQPTLVDPFCGGGSIPLEGQRLGLPVKASDLNPVAVLVTTATLEIPQRFMDKSPVNLEARRQKDLVRGGWKGVKGLTEDVRYYGKWVNDEAWKRLKHHYPKAQIANGREATVIAWLWARTVKCPNPVCQSRVPLVRSFALSNKRGRDTILTPVVDRANAHPEVAFVITKGPLGENAGTITRKGGGRCIACNSPVPFEHIRAEGRAGRVGTQLLAMVAEDIRGKAFLPSSAEHAEAASNIHVGDGFDTKLPDRALSFRVQQYGMTRHRDLFTPRQLATLVTLGDLVREVRSKVEDDARKAGLDQDDAPLVKGGKGVVAYADSVVTYLTLAISRLADYNCSLTHWVPSGEQAKPLFARQAIPMVWDFAESNVFANKGITWLNEVDIIADALESIPVMNNPDSHVAQLDAASLKWTDRVLLVSTDPPYYDNIGYADLSDFFYVWERRTLADVYPDIFSTMLSPKSPELVASPYRFKGNKDEARKHFEDGFRRVFTSLKQHLDPRFPMTVYYAFKQSEEDEGGSDSPSKVDLSTGWETMLESLLSSGFEITGTWPVRASQKWRVVSRGTNALASYVVLACRPRDEESPFATRKEFVSSLRSKLPSALMRLQQTSIAPVDLAQASIGPGMAVFSRYSKVLEADGTPMTVRTALHIINQELESFLRHEEGEMDPETQFCVSWFEQYGMTQGAFGEADVLARAKDTSVDAIVRLGALTSKGGKVGLKPRAEYPTSWNPTEDARLTLWGCTQHLVKRYVEDGEAGAAELAARLGIGRSEDAKTLAYRLFDICEKKGWPEEGISYNQFVTSWSEIQKKAAGIMGTGSQKVFAVE